MSEPISTHVSEPLPICKVTSKQAHLLKNRLLNWSLQPDSRQLKQFLCAESMTLGRFRAACRMYPELDEARQIANLRCANRLQEALWEDPDKKGSYVKMFIHLVDEEYYETQLKLRGITDDEVKAIAQVVGSTLMQQLQGTYGNPNNPE